MHSILHQTMKVIVLLNQATIELLERGGGINRLCILGARILMGLFFVYFGMDKFIHYSDSTIYMSSMGVPGWLLPLVLVLEIGGGVALLIGWRLRRVAGLLAAFTVLATLIFHSDFAEQIQTILFMKNMAIIGGLLLMVVIGGQATGAKGQRPTTNKA